MDINGKTSVIGLIGNPVEHTLSPVIHNGLGQRLGIPSVYVPFLVEKEGLGAAVKGAYALNIKGLNVTVPHKNDVMDALVEIDPAAAAIGAVNTLVRCEEKGGYKGYNTDMSGLRRQIKEDGISLKGETVVILGAGGAAKAVIYMCLIEGAAKIYLLNRTVGKAEEIAGMLDPAGKVIRPMALADYGKLYGGPEKWIVFQATSIGLAPHADKVVIEDGSFYDRVKIGVDLIYNPAETKFMKLVSAHGGKAFNALKMLLYQGIIAYELWHDMTVPEDVAAEIYTELRRRVYPKDNLVLIGYMGSGKTTFGKALAKHFDMDFLDTDEYIERQAGKKISAIFAEEGEEAFRKLETEVLAGLRDSLQNTVVATGGGMPLRPENARLLREIGRVCYLTAAPQVIYERVKEDGNRPLLKGEDPYGTICGMMKQREPLYRRAADVAVDANCDSIEEMLERLIPAVGRE